MFHGTLDDEAATRLMECARTVCVPGAEEFRMVPVEARVTGKRVVAFGSDRAHETVKGRVLGVLFESHDVEYVPEAIRRCDTLASTPGVSPPRAQGWPPSYPDARTDDA